MHVASPSQEFRREGDGSPRTVFPKDSSHTEHIQIALSIARRISPLGQRRPRTGEQPVVALHCLLKPPCC